MDWAQWHKHYDVSPDLQARLKLARRMIASALSAMPAGPVNIVSVCGGDGRDLIGALSRHPRRNDVIAHVLDTDAESLNRGRDAAAISGVSGQFRYIQADATLAASYEGLVPANLVVLSGMLGHLRHDDVPRLIANLPMLCETGGRIIWNRHLLLNDGVRMVPAIREFLRHAHFEELEFEITGADGFAAGCARFSGAAARLDPGAVLFEFVGLDRLAGVDVRKAPVEAPLTQSTRQHIFVEAPLAALFERQAAEHYDRPALAGGEWEPTYGELNTTANRLAHALLARDSAPRDRIALLMRHDAPLIAAAVAVIKAGKTVVVLNPGDPPSRLAQIRVDSEPRAVIADAENLELAALAGFSNFETLPFGENTAHYPGTNPGVPVSPSQTAFLVYTSGSTGRPNGVMQTHRQIAHNVYRFTTGLRYTSEDRILLLGSLSWAQGVATTWTALLNGATLCPFSVVERGVTGLAQWLRDRRVTVYISSASLFRRFMATLDPGESLPGIRVVRLGSETVVRGDFDAFCRHFGDGCLFVNTLSSSEVGNITQHPLTCRSNVSQGMLPIGKPAAGIEVQLLGDDDAPVARGQTGEIVVRGEYLSAGYWKNDALTAKRFLTDRASDNARLFRSGDLGMWRDDGSLMFAGRKDAQVKIRGHRIELSEIEEALARHPEVARVAVCARPGPDGEAQLTAHVVPRSGTCPAPQVLQAALRESLPDYMVPREFSFPDDLPLTFSGKIDRQALSSIAPAATATVQEPRFSTATEEAVAALWKDVLRRPRAGPEESFFDIGGDSLAAVVIAAKIHAALGVEIGLPAFANNPTLAALSRLVDDLRQASAPPRRPPLVRAPRDRPLPLSCMQQRAWEHYQAKGSSASYTRAIVTRIRGPLDVDALRRSVSYIVRRHEILRTTFEERGGRPVQVIHPAMPVEIPLVDLASAPDPEQSAEILLREDARIPLDLGKLPLVRMRLARIGHEDYRLLRVNHHMITDGWSWKIFFRELGAIYEAFRRGDPPPLPEELDLQYGDFAVWQRQCLEPGRAAFCEQIEWWKSALTGSRAPAELPFRRPAPVEDAAVSDSIFELELPRHVSEKLDRLARAQGATFYMVCLAAFTAQLAVEGAQDEVVLGTIITNRDRVELQEMFGMFHNFVTLRLRFTGAPTFRLWVSHVRDTLADLQAHAEIPYDQVCAELRQAAVHTPEIRMLFTLADELRRFRAGDLEFDAIIRVPTAMPWGFGVVLRHSPERDTIRTTFDARIYDPPGVRAHIARFLQLLDAASAEPDRPIAEVI